MAAGRWPARRAHHRDARRLPARQPGADRRPRPARARTRARTAFLRALPVGALNPGTAVFHLAFLPQFVDPAAGAVPLQLTVLGLLFMVLATAVDVRWALLGGSSRRLLPGLRMRVLDRITGTVLGALAVLTLRSSRAAG
ncbi:LysE family translocator [Klenkia marina]|uniref:LysE family translocator n=1 Tax=Klenkia marina TaxID=1960309 RepID=UPI001A9F8B3D|nr:LysE family transporter [Klenkia marina]